MPTASRILIELKINWAKKAILLEQIIVMEKHLSKLGVKTREYTGWVELDFTKTYLS